MEVAFCCITLSQQVSKLGNPLLSCLVFVCLHVTTYLYFQIFYFQLSGA